MATKVWLGGAAAVAQVDTVTIPNDMSAGQIIYATIGYRTISYTVLSTDTRDDIVDALIALWNATTIYEFAEVTASVDYLDGYEADQIYSGDIILTADTAGKPFVVAWTVGGSGTNEKQLITITGAAGGTFVLTWNGQSTGALAYNISATDLETALEGLTGIGAGNVSVTGSDGGPWTVEFIGDLAATNVSQIQIDTTNLTNAPEIQVIDLGGPTGGTFKLRYGLSGSFTGNNLNYNATAAEVKAEIESETSGTTTFSVTGANGGPWTVTPTAGALLSSGMQPIVIDDTNLTGGLAANVSVAETSPGGNGFNDQFSADIRVASSVTNPSLTITGNASVSAGTWDLTIAQDDGTVFLSLTGIAYDITSAGLQTLIETTGQAADGGGFENMIAVNMDSTGDGTEQLSAGNNFVLTLLSGGGDSGGFSPDNSAHSTINSASLTGGTYTITDITSSGATWSSNWNLGLTSYYFTINGESTGDIPIDALEATVLAELEALSVVGSGNVAVNFHSSSSYGRNFRIEFIGDFLNQATGFTIDIASNAVSTQRTIFRSSIGGGGDDEVQTISVSGSPASGQFSLVLTTGQNLFNNNSTYPSGHSPLINYNATAAEVQTALEAMDNVGVGEAVCTGGPLPGTDVVVTFGGTLSGTNMATMTAVQWENETTQQGGTTVTGTAVTTVGVVSNSTTTENEGPNDWRTLANWSTYELPVNGDKVYIIDNAYSILYGLDQSSVTLAELHVEQTFTGYIGLPIIHVNASDATITYPEYRTKHLKISATEVFIGDKAGNGSQRLKFDFGSAQTTILVTNSGSRINDATPPIQILGTHASNALNVNRGDVAVAFYPGEVSTFATIRQAFIDNAETDSTLYVGDDVTLTNVIKSGGIATLKSATTLIDQTAGTLTVEEGAHTEINAYAGSVFYNSTGTLALIDISGDTTLSFDQDRRPKDVTLIKVNGSEPEVYDQSNAITTPVINLERGATFQQLFFGSKIEVTIGPIS